TVTGTGEPETTVTIEVDGEEVGTVPVDENGDWAWTPEDELALGEHVVTANGENGSSDETTVTIIEEDVDREVTGGMLFGCHTAGSAPSMLMLLLSGLLLVGLRRRTRQDHA